MQPQRAVRSSIPPRTASPKLPDLYYLRHFCSAISSLKARYAGLLSDEESGFIQKFAELSQGSQCLLIRLLMRQGAFFRRKTLAYPELPDLDAALHGLGTLGWIEADPVVTAPQLFQVLSREEWRRTFGSSAKRRGTDQDDIQLALSLHTEADVPRRLSQWNTHLSQAWVHVVIRPVATRLRQLYFGNDHQTWAEFVLADLGVQRFEAVPFDPASCAFANREDIEHFYRLNDCCARLGAGEPAFAILTEAGDPQTTVSWIRGRFGQLKHRLGQILEKQGDYDLALQAYRESETDEGRIRIVRLQERMGLTANARDEAESARHATHSEGHREAIDRVLRRLQRRPGDVAIRDTTRQKVDTVELSIPPLALNEQVERRLCSHLSSSVCEAFYVENSLFTSLFGLLFWEAIFVPVPGAFFHPFQSGPSDLYAAEFRSRRVDMFERFMNLLDSGEHDAVIWRHYRAKAGISSPFVHWRKLNPQLLSLALTCIPPNHLKLVFERMLRELDNNCTGLPDIIQFWPAERRYRLVEIKAPGDRLQDNQRRWMTFFSSAGIPAVVCKVTWGRHI